MTARRARAGQFERLREPLTKRPVWRTRASSGPEVWVAPMPGFSKLHAMITTRYGSLDTQLPDGTPLPDGIAHFLEHKMFQTEQGDVFDVYAARGASANAFTTFTHTTYLFTCTNRFDRNLATLLESMATIATDPEGVEREKGIIGQELAMYADDPGWRGYFNLLGALFRRHPVRIDIGGTADSISVIDRGLLERTHRAYYSPRNLVLVVAGDADPRRVLDRVDAVFHGRAPGRRHRRRAVEEPRSVARRQVAQALSISRPHVLLGIKDRPARGRLARIRQRIHTSMALEILFGDGGLIQGPLYREGLVDDSLTAGFEAEEDYAFALVAAEVDEIEPYRKRLQKAWRGVLDDGIGAEDAERCRRRFLGRHLRVFNRPESCAHWLLGLALEGVDPGTGVAAVEAATPARLLRRLRALGEGARAWSILTPRENGSA